MGRKKQTLKQKLLAEFLFWLHFVISVVILIMGLFIPWDWVIIVLVILRVQQIILHGCVITLLEKRAGDIPKGMVFYQIMAQRFLGYHLERKYVAAVLVTHYSLALLLAIIIGHYNLRIHL